MNEQRKSKQQPNILTSASGFTTLLYLYQPLLFPPQLGKLWGAELKIAKLKLVLSGQSLAHIKTSLQAVAKMAMVDLF